MSDLISRSYILNIIEMWMKVPSYNESERNIMRAIDYEVRTAPSAEPDDWLEKNKDLILQAGMEGREVEFRIGGRLFSIREKAQ